MSLVGPTPSKELRKNAVDFETRERLRPGLKRRLGGLAMAIFVVARGF